VNRITLENNWGVIKPYAPRHKKFADVAHLLRDTVIEYTKCNTHYCEMIGWHDFLMGYGELQNQGAIFHSFHHALTNNYYGYEGAVFPECKVELTKYRYKETPKQLRIDFWVLVKGKSRKNTVLLVEYKHPWGLVEKNYRFKEWSDNKDKKLLAWGGLSAAWKNGWQKLNEKVTLYKRVCELLKHCRSDKLVKVVLMTIPVCQDSLKKEDDREGKRGFKPVHDEDFAERLEEIYESERFSPKPEWRAYWLLPENRQEENAEWKDDENKEHNFYFIGMYFLAGLETVDS